MPRKPKYTREELLQAALEITRESGLQEVNARTLGARLHTAPATIFTHFESVEAIRLETIVEARKVYNRYLEAGLKLTPELKGAAMAYIHFAMDEPTLFSLVFMRKTETMTFDDFLGDDGHRDELVALCRKVFKLNAEDAEWFYRNAWIYGHGIASACACGVASFTDAELAEMIGVYTRGMLLSLRAGKDERSKVIPGTDVEIPGTLEDYLGLTGTEA